MRTLADFLRITPGLEAEDAEWLHLLVEDWHLLADLSFADLTLWVPLAEGPWWCVAQVRPLTAPTSRPDDVVGAEVSGEEAHPFLIAYREGRPVTEGAPDWSGPAPRRREVIPVRHDGVVVAVLARDTNLAVTRAPSTLELTYLDIAADLCLMVSAGTFPPEKLQDAEMSPRVGDGLLRLDGQGRAVYASPNALSAYRRMGVAGDVVGRDLAEQPFLEAEGLRRRRVGGNAERAGPLEAVALAGEQHRRLRADVTRQEGQDIVGQLFQRQVAADGLGQTDLARSQPILPRPRAGARSCAIAPTVNHPSPHGFRRGRPRAPA